MSLKIYEPPPGDLIFGGTNNFKCTSSLYNSYFLFCPYEIIKFADKISPPAETVTL